MRPPRWIWRRSGPELSEQCTSSQPRMVWNKGWLDKSYLLNSVVDPALKINNLSCREMQRCFLGAHSELVEGDFLDGRKRLLRLALLSENWTSISMTVSATTWTFPFLWVFSHRGVQRSGCESQSPRHDILKQNLNDNSSVGLRKSLFPRVTPDSAACWLCIQSCHWDLGNAVLHEFAVSNNGKVLERAQ